IGGPKDVGLVATPGGAKNALLLAAGLVVFTTVINMVGVKTMARINNFGVAAELVGVSLLIILLAVHVTRRPALLPAPFRPRGGQPVGVFRPPPNRLADERVRPLRFRPRRISGRGDARPAAARPAGDPPGAGRRGAGRLPGHRPGRDGGAQHSRP